MPSYGLIAHKPRRASENLRARPQRRWIVTVKCKYPEINQAIYAGPYQQSVSRRDTRDRRSEQRKGREAHFTVKNFPYFYFFTEIGNTSANDISIQFLMI
jgi:hypothetical protein